MKSLIVLLVVVSYAAGQQYSCPSLEDYETGDNCTENPWKAGNITSVAEVWGVNWEKIVVKTNDNFELELFKISNNVQRATPIILAPAVFSNGESMMLNDKNSLVHFLVYHGYAVYLMNYRNTKYATNRMWVADDPLYWDQTLDSMIQHDVRKMIEKVGERTQTQAVLIGYSGGSTLALGYAASYPDEARQYLKAIVAISPTAYFVRTRGLFRHLVPLIPTLLHMDKSLMQGQILNMVKQIMDLCAQGVNELQTCLKTYSLLFGSQSDDLAPKLFENLFTNLIEPGSFRIIDHMAQILLTGEFKMYDWGPRGNMDVYKKITPPAYNLTKVSVPVSIWTGKNDFLATQETAEKIRSELPEEYRCDIHINEWHLWGHLNVIAAKQTATLFLEELDEELKHLENGNCRTSWN